uniref:Peroxisomal N(1)-acetyl-spermine/spermidine oxidase n=1 Tax=Lygus hesperus TaxID=30085 RepID=A0A0A9W0D2_LYGHE
MATGGGPSTSTPTYDPEMDSIPGLDIELKGGVDSDTIALIESGGEVTFQIDETGKLVPTQSEKEDTPVIVSANKEATPPKKRGPTAVELEGAQRLSILSSKQEYEDKLYRLRIRAAEMDVEKKKKETEHVEKMQQYEEKKWEEELEFSRKMWRAKLRSINLEIQRKKKDLLLKKKNRK